MIKDWSKFHLNELKDDDYGLAKWFPHGTSQLIYELNAFRISQSNPGFARIKSSFIHFLRIVRRLWPDKIEIYKDTPYGRIFNTYFLDVAKALCTFEDVAFTGPASSAKTFTTSVYNLVMFYASPDNTLCMISTTSGSASERRIWADVQTLHRDAKFKENEIEPIGIIVPYLKSLVFDFNKAIDPSANNERDMRNSIQVIPIAKDSKGDEALAAIMGAKNKRVLWTIDEMPAMSDNVDRPCSNLRVNPFFQSIFLGNAALKTDPHGMACEPENGWASVNLTSSCKWNAKTGRKIYFLHGEEGPNDDPRIQLNEIKKKTDFPFPYLSNSIFRLDTAKDRGRGDVDLGKKTIDYIRFCIGAWAGDDIVNCVLSEAFVIKHEANLPAEPWGYGKRRTFASLDPAFTIGGDANSLSFAEFGLTINGDKQIKFDKDCLEISPPASNKEEYERLVAREVVKLCKERGVEPSDFCIDISNDAGRMLQYIVSEWGQQGQVALSSNESSDDDRYATKVTQYWFSAVDLIGSKSCRGFNILSNYFSDLSRRRYATVTKNSVAVEKKKDMKKRIKRSPDNGDSFAYLCYMMVRANIVETFSERLAKDTKADSDEDQEEFYDENNYHSFDSHSIKYGESLL